MIFAIDRELKIQFVNRAWDAFARANGGERCLVTHGVGSSVQSAIPDVLRRFYDRAYGDAFAGEVPWEHLYECSSPTKIRSVRMRAAALPDGSHLVITNDVLREVDAVDATEPRAGDYLDANGILVLCAHCRRSRRCDGTGWDWVPGYVAFPYPLSSHGLCDPCVAHHYPE